MIYVIRVRQIKILVDKEQNITERIAKRLHIEEEDIVSYELEKKSIDARNKNSIYYVYDLLVSVKKEKSIPKYVFGKDVFVAETEKYVFPKESLSKDKKIIIVGSGPSGLFCAYLLGEAGYKVLVLEQGEMMEERIKTVEEFFKTNKLNVFSNVQFGEGGAGTFSDGKLNTLVKDKMQRGRKVFETFVEHGAPKEIMYEQKPHIGTDVMRNVIVSMRDKMKKMGVDFKYNSKMTNVIIEKGIVVGVEVNNSEVISCDILVLAIGHSARDTFEMLYNKNIEMKAKNFAVGVRVEHPQKMINENQYGKFAHLLSPASYKLTYQASNKKAVYSFCMCPGGFVVNASSEEGRVVVNGMSNYKRDEVNANSAIVVNVNNKDFGNGVLAGMEFQRKLEEKAYKLGAGLIPTQLYKDFVANKESNKYGSFAKVSKGMTSFANLRELFPDSINEALLEAIPYFDTKIKGFARDDMIMSGVESRTSSPVMIIRNELGESSIKGLYPCGEGCGYAGGITTSAMDGIKIAELIVQKEN